MDEKESVTTNRFTQTIWNGKDHTVFAPKHRGRRFSKKNAEKSEK